MNITYIIGVPGAGKTTALRLATAHLATIDRTEPIKHRERLPIGGSRPVFVELGPERGTFSGTDGLGMSVQPKVLAWLRHGSGPRTVVAEGDRLANESFLGALESEGWHVDVVLIDTPADVAAARRAARGSSQNEAWLKGRATKVARLAEQRRAVRIDGAAPVEFVAAVLAELLPGAPVPPSPTLVHNRGSGQVPDVT